MTEEKDLISKHHAADELVKVERQLLDAQREFLGKQRSAIQAITGQVPSQEAAQLVTELLAILQRAEEQYKDTRVIPGLAFGRRHDYGWTVVMATVLNHLSQMMLHSYDRSDWIPLSEQDMEQWLKDQKRLIKTLESPTHSESST